MESDQSKTRSGLGKDWDWGSLERGPVGGAKYWVSAAMPGWRRISNNTVKAYGRQMQLDTELWQEPGKEEFLPSPLLEVKNKNGSGEVAGSPKSHRRWKKWTSCLQLLTPILLLWVGRGSHFAQTQTKEGCRPLWLLPSPHMFLSSVSWCSFQAKSPHCLKNQIFYYFAGILVHLSISSYSAQARILCYGEHCRFAGTSDEATVGGKIFS